MHRMTVRPKLAALGMLVSLLLFATAGCGGGEEVNARTLARARRLWQRAGLRDYNLEWTSTGARAGRYLVSVRGGAVREVRQVTPDGKVVPARPGDSSYFGVEGLFRTIEMDADHCAALAQSEGGLRVTLRFWPDPTYGYPRRYRRDIAGSLRSLAIDVVRLEPAAADAPLGADSRR